MAQSSAKLLAFGICCIACLVSASVVSSEEKDWRTARKVGGALTVYSFGESPYNHGAPFLELHYRRTFSDGALAFRKNQPTAASGELGIKAHYNGPSCETCHLRDGRGVAHSASFERTGFSVKAADDGTRVPIFRHPVSSSGSERLQRVEWEVRHRIELPGDEVAELIAPVAVVDGKKKPVDLRNAPGVYGLGLLEAIPEGDIRKAAEAREFAAVGVKGVLGSTCSTDHGKTCDGFGRFGWKGSVVTLEAQTRAALAGELGISEPDSKTGFVARSEYHLLVSNLSQYLSMLAVPARRAVSTPQHLKGADLFKETGCIMCHTPSWRTGDGQHINKWVRDQQIYPFTDLLLHDMGQGLADSNGDRLSRFWRTPALWGVGTQNVISNEVGFLHDGRARNLLEAILWHGGEATHSVSRFRGLTKEDRQRLIEFVVTL